MLIFEDESGVKTTNSKKSSNADTDEVEDGDIDETPRPRGLHEPIELLDSDNGPYVTPFPLEKKCEKWFHLPLTIVMWRTTTNNQR